MDLEKEAIKRIQYAEEIAYKFYKKPMVLAYSGGKDSDVLLELALRAGVDMVVEHNHTTADAPQTVYHIREVFRRLEEMGVPSKINWPEYKKQRTTLWQLIAERGMPPTRIARYCCQVLKEQTAKNTVSITGIRWSESNARSKRGVMEKNAQRPSDRVFFMDDNNELRRELEACQTKSKTTINPIINWTDYSLYQFIYSEKIEMNPLYECGFSRVGCIGCPMAGEGRKKEFAMFPSYERAYRNAFARMLALRKQRRPDAPTKWITADDVFNWWMEDKNLDGQISMDDLMAKVAGI